MRSFDSRVTLVSAQSSDKGVEACFLKRLSRRLYMRRSRGWVNLWFTKLTYVRNFMFDNYVIDVFFLSLRLSANALALPDNAFVSRTFEKIFFKLTCMQFSRYNPGLYYLCPMGLSGLEPPTSRLSGVRSNQLSYKPIFQKPKAFEWRWRDSNSRPPACKAGALPTELHPDRKSVV